MPKVIAGIYEIQEQIGAGGGGIVYLGRHLRLHKKIVLKEDKRTLNTDAEILRREVDMLKELNHTYIPQVYDFVEEDGKVYTIMDFIEGESLDHVLERGTLPGQPQVIKWACQLLEALEYLHNYPPYGILHGDIKPANIMLRSNGDICLIDYNIALALGEDGAVKAGFSRGYASPEHYGLEYASERRRTAAGLFPFSENAKQQRQQRATELTKTVRLDTTDYAGNKETAETQQDGDNKGSTVGHGVVMLDVRSDIYSLGATLYHLLSGQRPNQNAVDVKPLGAYVCSPAVSMIIEKAMAPSQDLRYQSAEEMLTAFRQLYQKDIRVIRHRRRIAAWTAILSLMFLSGGASTLVGMRRLEKTQEALTLAEYSANHLADGDMSGAIEYALKALPEEKSIFVPPVTAQAQKALTDALGVYDLSDGFKFLDSINLPSAPFSVTLSPGGTCFAAIYQQNVVVYDVESRQEVVTLPAQNSALSDVIFVDETRMIYAGASGVTAYDLHQKKILWTGEEATSLAVSDDKNVVASVNRDADHAVIYRMSDGTKTAECSFEGHHMGVTTNDIFANPADRIFSLNKNGNLLAVSFSEGELWIFDWQDPENNMIVYDESEYMHFEGGFYENYFAFTANKSDEALFGIIDTKEGVYIGTLESREDFLLKTNENGIYLANGNVLVKFDPHTLEDIELAYTDNVKIIGFSVGNPYTVVATDDNSFSFYGKGANLLSSEICEKPCDFVDIAGVYALMANHNDPYVRLLKRESHDEAELLSYDAWYVHDEARISQDGKTAMFFNYEGFCIYDMDGTILTEVTLPEPENIYDQQFRKSDEGSWLEVIWYDGTVRYYSAKDGSMISETMGEPPQKDLYEEFFTDQYRIASSLHGAPEVYDLKSGKKVAVLEEEDYLTYVTQVDEYIVTQYVRADGEYYGLLLNEKLEVLAELPYLCDIREDGWVVFDYNSGNLRQCQLYSLEQLKTLGKKYLLDL